jgi:cyclic beta-1,2-glucan synthetase
MSLAAWQRLVPQAPAALLRLLDPGPAGAPGEHADGALQAPVRSEIFGAQRFAEHGRSLGRTHDVRPASLLGASFFPRLRDNVKILRQSQRAIALQASAGHEISPASLWLLDNYHLIEAQLQAIHEGLPRGYFRGLPVLQQEPLAGLPRVYSVAWAFVAHTDSAFDEDLLLAYLGGYQESRPLNLGEIWALPTTLRVVLVENLRRLAERLATQKAAREVANLSCDGIATLALGDLQEMLALMQRRGVAAAFLSQMGQRLQDRQQVLSDRVPAELRSWLQSVLPKLAELQAQQSIDQTADNLSVSNAVASLRAIGSADWPEIVARCSGVMRLMLQAPLFAAEHHATRDQTLHAIERLARRSGVDELRVTQALLSLMRAPSANATEADASHWLQGAGRERLEQTLGLRSWAPWRAAAQRMALPLYLGTVALGVGGLVSWMVHPGASSWLMLALLAWPASEAVIALLHRLVSESTTPRHLPRLALLQGIPPEHRVLVVIPALLSSAAVIDELAHRLHLHCLANPEPHAQFALLTDWGDADTEHAPTDAALLAHACARVAALNALQTGVPTAAAAPPRFLLLHRPRSYSPTEARWIGWERKRGKLEQLVANIATAGPDAVPATGPFIDLGAMSQVCPGTRYVVTLDSDTQLPPGRLRELVGVAAHPANRPRLAADGRRVEAGFGILQPRLATPLPSPSEDTIFHRLFAGQCGIDPYSAATSEVYQDLFDEGTYTGKGLLDVAAVHAVLGGSLPEGQVLSHDLIEGALARCGAVTDVTVVEDAPFHAEVAAARVHRWTRGDWQLLPILLVSFLRPARYPLGALNRWKITDNLRRSLVPPASLLLLVLALAGTAVAPGPAIALVLAAFAAGGLMGALAGFVPSHMAVAELHFQRQALRALLLAIGGGLWHLAMLLQHAAMALDAILRALHRVLFSDRHLLQWTTAAAVQAAVRPDLKSALRRGWPAPVAAAGIGLVLWAVHTPYPITSTVLCLLWAGAPLWSWTVSRTGLTRQPVVCPPADATYLLGVARDTWRFFERVVTPADNYLPPDNLQTAPHDMLAHRTSPTNMGLYLLSVACARQFGWITSADMLQRLQATLATMDKLQRHRGHFLNWYDTQTCAALLPMYVSTVDSGNLSGHLLAVAQACTEQARAASTDAAGTLAADFLALAARCERLAWEPEFGFLYHASRHLLHIGYRVAEHQLDDSLYDLLASESRLTSLLAIAKGDVPVRHWAALGRPFHAVGSLAALRSWSGSMFEYLMPTLVLAEPHGSVLHEAGVAAVIEQQAFARAQGVPWGISESAYAGCDHTLAYQYAPQGVPRLALRRTPPDELVIAPYATALAAQLLPHRARQNYAALQTLGARDTLGFIEALDFTPTRQTGSAGMTPVRTFMAHHQGMSIVALANVLLHGVAQRWGMANPCIEAVSSLLHERAPREVSRLVSPGAGVADPVQRRSAPTLLRDVPPGVHAIEPTHLLSNGSYSVGLRANGAGHSRCGSFELTRRRDDALRDASGSFFWLRRSESAAPVSLTQHPAPDARAQYHSAFDADRVSFDARWSDLHTRITVWVSPEDDIEFRQVELHNLGERPLSLELISAFEVTLADPRADEAHPAFGNLFVQARTAAAPGALHFERKPRLAGEQGLHMAHFLAESLPALAPLRSLRRQTDRQRWLGRNRAPWAPLARMEDWSELPDDVLLNTGLDPMCALGARLSIAAGGRVRLTFATAASRSADTLHAVIDKYRQASHVERASLMSATLASIRLRDLGLNPAAYTALQSLSTALLMTLTRPQAVPAAPCDKRLLWRFGISGDRPLILVSAAAMPGLGLVRTLTRALSLWSWGGVACDLVVVNAEPASYLMGVQRELGALRDRHDLDAGARRPGQAPSGWHLLRADDLSSAELATLHGVARLSLQADGRPLVRHLDDWARLHALAQRGRQGMRHVALVSDTHVSYEVPIPQGTFGQRGDFDFEVGSRQRPQRPWINVLANPVLGTHVSEAGGGSTWALNSRLNQLTPWSNDPVADPPCEWLLLQDQRTREVWSLTPSAFGEPGLAYAVSHGQGSTRITHRRGGLEVSVQWCVDSSLAVKQVQVRVRNHGTRTRQLRLVAVAEWMLGAQRSDRASVHTAMVRQSLGYSTITGLLATQLEAGAGFGQGTAFLAFDGSFNPAGLAGDAVDDDWTCDRRECFDPRGHPVVPDVWGRQQGNGLDPCAALGRALELPPDTTRDTVLLLGWAESPLAAQQLLAKAAAVPAPRRLNASRDAWDSLLGATVVRTPDPLFDAMVNRWLLYQAVGCRLWAKAGFYQAGGATGFRDQLQDAMALAWAAPAMLREQILRCAARQFAEGDVQHWWHAPQGAGVRTHFSDDLLWLPYALVHYLHRTGDTAVLDASVPFVEGLTIPDGAEDIYGIPSVTDAQASVYEHAARSLDRSLRVGAHGLPLMGSGDWNDGMNRVGHEGRGESVWLAWFLCRVVAGFAPIALARGDSARAQRWTEAASGWQAMLEKNAWDGDWYLRAFFDRGEPLGSHANPEARIDLIAQAWAVLSEVAPREHQVRALAAVQAQLVHKEAGLIRLLHPPLAHSVPSAGYIQAYPPGVRENGGQYSHAGVWALMAQLQHAKTLPDPAPALDRAWTWFQHLSPAHRAATPGQREAYAVEPYVMAGDVYTAAPYVGRGGWSWYTGAAAWLHRAAVESIFGLDIGAQTLVVRPGLPSHWPRAEITLKRDGRTLQLLLLRATADDALQEAADWAAGQQPQLLLPGQALAWTEQAASSAWVVPILSPTCSQSLRPAALQPC